MNRETSKSILYDRCVELLIIDVPLFLDEHFNSFPVLKFSILHGSIELIIFIRV